MFKKNSILIKNFKIFFFSGKIKNFANSNSKKNIPHTQTMSVRMKNNFEKL